MKINTKCLPKIIYLFGKRQGHGKDTCCDILSDILEKRNISFSRGMFAKNLKKHVCERYGLDYSKMDSQEYKLSLVKHASPKTSYITDDGREVPLWVYMNSGELKVTQKVTARTVRDILIDEGRFARSIWDDVWAWQVYRELFNSGAEIGFVSDWRYGNEANLNKMYDMFLSSVDGDTSLYVKPKLVRIQVYRPKGVFKNDGADAELPDDFNFYDYNIMNDEVPNWRDNLRNQLEDIISKTYN